MMEREKASKNLNVQEASWNFDLSDLKNDKTQYLDKSPYPKSNANSPFEPKEISARSTHIQSKSKHGHLDFDEIMKSSSSQAVRNKYRESLAVGRLSNIQKSNDGTFRASISSKNNENIRTTSTSNRKDFWDEANPSFSSFTGKNITYSNEEFVPAENMAAKLDEDEKMQEMEYAVIPRVNKVQEETVNWENSIARQPEMSFGQYCMDKIRQHNIRDIYGNASPPKRQDRIPLVELTANESKNGSDLKNLYDGDNLAKLIKKCDKSQAEKIIFKKKVESQVKKVAKDIGEHFEKQNDVFSNSIVKIMQELDVDKIVEMAERERSRKNENVPVHDENGDDLQRHRNELQIPSRGVKRRQSIVTDETPKSALDKCLRSRSPVNKIELEKAAARLKPKMVYSEESLFKKPLPCDSTVLKSCLKSPSRNLTDNSQDHQTREYVTAMQSLSIRSQDEKLSLPNYALQRPAMTSPTSSVRSMNSQQWSPECGLRRSASQLSNESEFNDDFLPIKIKNIDNRKISFPSVKIDKSVIKSISIQNGAHKKLPLRVKVIGAGFSVTPQEEFRMVPMEARTFHIKFSPSTIGPARGCLIFELITNKQCSKSIPLYGYGGHASINIENAQKGPFGPAFITMGTVKDLPSLIERNIKLVNKGTLPSFVSLAFERTKLSDFVLSNSIILEPMQLRIEPGKSANVKLQFKATKSEIRKIISLNKDVTTIGEICVISGDEATRLRVLKNQHFVEPKFLDYLPKSLPNESEIQLKLQKFKEDLSRDKLTSIMGEIRTQEVALTINRNLEDTILLSTEMSLVDDTHMSFATFVDQTNHPLAMDTGYTMDEDPDESVEFLESKYFRITPSELIFKRSIDTHETVKAIKIESLAPEVLYIEAVPSNHKIVSAIRPCGKLSPRDTCEIKVKASQIAFENLSCVTAFIVLIIFNARIEIPVKIVD